MISDDLTLEKIDFDWVKSQTKIAPLRKALKLLEMDGNYYTELIKAVEDQIVSIDPKYAKASEVQIDPLVKKQAQIDVEKWAENPTQEKNKRLAETEKNKGNEALKSNDLREAINYYTKSIEFDRQMAASYCNRAFVYLKLKEYQNVINDCDYAIALQSDYTKAYHRRGKAYFALKQYDKAYLDFKYILQLEPDNSEVNGELRECRKFLTDQQINSAESIYLLDLDKQFIEKSGGFKKVQIVEEDEEEEIPISKAKQLDYQKEYDEIIAKKNQITTQIQKGSYAQSISQIQELLKENQQYVQQQRFIELRAVLLSNLAYCHLQLQEYPKVIEYCGNILEDQVAWDIKTKAYLRRGMAYERLDKVVLSKLDFLRVKDLDPGNLQASQALDRLSKLMSAEENQKVADIRQKERDSELKKQQSNEAKQEILQPKEQPVKQQILEPQNKTLTIQEVNQGQKLKFTDAEVQNKLNSFKEGGNAHFKLQQLQQAIDVWGQGIKFYEENPSPTQTQIYLQLITNSCLCLSQLNQHDQVIELASKVLTKDPNNLKALYRRGIAYQAKAQLSTQLEEQNDFLENGRKDLERLVYLDSQNSQAKEKLTEVQKQNVEIRVKLREKQESQPKVEQKVTKVEENKGESQKQQQPNEQNTKKSINQQKIEQIGQNLTVNVIQDILNKKQQPETATVFEKNMNTFKKATQQQIIDYVYQVENIQQIYGKKDLPTEILFQILNAGSALKQEPEYNDKVKVILRDRLPKTFKFHLCVNMLSKKEKSIVRELLEFHLLSDLFGVYQIK